MLNDTHPHLFDVAGAKDSRGTDAPLGLTRNETPGLNGTLLYKND
jgi:hypothetical protein